MDFQSIVVDRLLVAILLLISGFLVIFFTFFELPKITQQFQEETKRQVREDGIQDALLQVTRLIKSDDFERMSDQVSALGSEFKKTQDSISKLSKLTGELALVRDQGKPAVDAIVKQENAIALASKMFTERVDSFNTSIGPLNESLEKLSQSIDGWTDPIELRTAFENANNELSEYESKVASLLSGFTEVWDERNEPGPWAWINKNERVAIDKILKWAREDGKTGRLDSFRGSLLEIEKQSKIIPIDNELKNGITSLQQQLKKLIDAKSDLLKETTKITEASSDLKAAIDNLNDNKALKEIGDGSDELLETIGFASEVVFNSKESYDRTKSTLKKLEEATENLGGLARLQTELAFKGASPAVFLLLAIGGMFVTFGLSSMLKWVKGIDEKQALDTWARRNKLYTSISASLIQHGVDPTPVLSRLQNAFPTNEADHAGVKMPISETIAEIGKMIQSKK